MEVTKLDMLSLPSVHTVNNEAGAVDQMDEMERNGFGDSRWSC